MARKRHKHKSAHNCILHVGGSHAWERLCMQRPFRLQIITSSHRWPDGVVTSGVSLSALDENDLVCENVTCEYVFCFHFEWGGGKQQFGSAFVFLHQGQQFGPFFLLFLDEHSQCYSAERHGRSVQIWQLLRERTACKYSFTQMLTNSTKPRITGCDCCDNDGLMARTFTFILQFSGQYFASEQHLSSLPSLSVREPFF